MQDKKVGPTLKAPVDIHCHILPAWDDGPKTLELSLEMVRRAGEAGVEYIFATPHVGRAFKGVEHPAHTIPQGVEALQQAIDEQGINVKIVPGAEVMLGSVDILKEPALKPEWTYSGKGKYILVESPFGAWPDFGNNLLYEISRRGAIPIIAHPERYANVQKNREILSAAIGQGALLQITADSLLGNQAPKPMQQCALALLEAGWAHFVASDSHSSTAALPASTAELLIERVGEARARQILETNPLAVLNGKPLPMQHTPEKRKQGFMARVLGRRN